jgi:prepilin-type processing-associated H-X9-DG protein
MEPRHSRRITAIETMVILGLAGLLALLVFPALQSARAAARRAACVDNLGQIGRALTTYQQANETLPMSHALGPGHGNGQSVFTAILPYMEQAAIFNAYNFWLENLDAANSTVVSMRIETFVCPDNPSQESVPARKFAFDDSTSAFAKGFYGANWGGGRNGWGDDFARRRGTYLGVMMTVIAPDGERPAADGKPVARNIRLRDITDGTSLTLAMVEKLDSFGWAVGGWGGSEFDVNLRPNDPGDDPLARKVYTGSPHEEGVHALFVDGSVRQLGRKMDRDVWYAAITREGGERLDLDLNSVSAPLVPGTVDLARRLRPDAASKAAGQLAERLIANPPRPAAAKSRMSLYLLEVATGKASLVASEPAPGLDQCGSPAWSADGQALFYDAQPRNQIEKTRLYAHRLKADRLQLDDLGPGNCPSPAPDAVRLLFLQNSGQVPDAEPGIWLMRGDGSDRRRLGGYGRPKWSPDGHQFLICSFSNPTQVIVIDDRPGRPSGELQVAGKKVFLYPTWAVESTIVAVLGEDGQTAGDSLALIDVSDPGQAAVKQVLWRKTDGIDVSPSEPVFSAATGRCVFVGATAKGMALFEVDQKKPGPPRQSEKDSFDNLIRDLAFSPDGRYLLFCSNRPDRAAR